MKIYKAEYSDIGRREINEDAARCKIGNECVYGIVADGLGGEGHGNIASGIAVEKLSGWCDTKVFPEQEELIEWFQDANREILMKKDAFSGMKTTVVFLAIDHKRAVWAHVGDSRLYHFCDGELLHYTKDHSLPHVLVNMGELSREEIPTNPDRNVILRSLGDEEMKVELHQEIELSSGRNAFLLCTDGFWEYVSDLEIQTALQESESPQQWLEYLRRKGDSKRADDADNHTAIAIFVEI